MRRDRVAYPTATCHTHRPTIGARPIRFQGVRSDPESEESEEKYRSECFPIIPTSGYFEWPDTATGKQPWYFTNADGDPTTFVA
jgi:putative SOS response-associated peptidase YedK